MTGNGYLLAEWVSLGLPVHCRCDVVHLLRPSHLCTCLDFLAFRGQMMDLLLVGIGMQDCVSAANGVPIGKQQSRSIGPVLQDALTWVFLSSLVLKQGTVTCDC